MVYLVFKTDVHHSYSSRDLLAIATTKNKAVKFIKQVVKKEGEKLNKDDLYNINTINQTQGYIGEGEFIIESQKTNVLF